MSMMLNIAGASKNVVGFQFLGTSGGVPALLDIIEAWVRTDVGILQFFTELRSTLSTDLALGRGNSAATIPVTSQAVTANVGGGAGEISYAWTRTDTDPQPWTIGSPTAQTTTFTTDCAQSDRFTATFICTATDADGQVVASDPVTADCANIYYGGGYEGSVPPLPGNAYP